MRGPKKSPKKQLQREIFTSAICVRLLLIAFLSKIGTFECVSTMVMSERTEGVIELDRRRDDEFPGVLVVVERSPVFSPSTVGSETRTRQ